jgi:hypothetical protein
MSPTSSSNFPVSTKRFLAHLHSGGDVSYLLRDFLPQQFQEVIAPSRVLFFDKNWSLCGSKTEQPTLGIISRITHIDEDNASAKVHVHNDSYLSSVYMYMYMHERMQEFKSFGLGKAAMDAARNYNSPGNLSKLTMERIRSLKAQRCPGFCRTGP